MKVLTSTKVIEVVDDGVTGRVARRCSRDRLGQPIRIPAGLGELAHRVVSVGVAGDCELLADHAWGSLSSLFMSACSVRMSDT